MANPISVPGTVIPSGSLISPGGAQGLQGLQGTTALADATQNGLLRQVSGNSTDFIDGTNHSQALQPVIWSVRLRSVNIFGNPTFEVDQRNTGAALTNPADGTFLQDRWQLNKSALSGTVNTALQSVPTAPIVVPGTNFGITQSYQRFTVGTAQASLAAGDYYLLIQSIEGPRWRSLASDVHSLSLLVRSSVASLAFSVSLRDSGSAHSLVKQCTLGATPNTWTLITLPSLPIWSGTFSAAPGQVAYLFAIALAAGTTYTATASSAWQAGNLLGVAGMTNFLATAGATFDIAFAQHQPGALCETPIDCPFTQNLDDCLRYFQKTYSYGTAVGTASAPGGYKSFIAPIAQAAGFGTVSFLKPVAKTPTVTLYNVTTGAANSVRDGGAVDHSGASAQGIGDSGFSYIVFTTATTGSTNISAHYTADTGW